MSNDLLAPDLASLAGPDPQDAHPTTWSRRRVLAMVGTGAALPVIGSLWLFANPDQPQPTRTVGRGRTPWTCFCSVAVLTAVREARRDAGAHLHEDAAPSGGPLVNRTWSTTVRVQVAVHNAADRAVLLSPGQFRLRVGAAGTTVAPYDVERPASLIPAGKTLDTWISYLAPAEESDFSLEYDDTGLSHPLDLRLSLPAASGPGGSR